MSKLQPIWQNIPFHFKKSVVENLDYVSRCHLRSCSKEEKNIVDSCSSVIDYLCLSLTEPAFGNGEDAEKPAQISIKDKKTEFSKNFKKDDVIERFLSIFLNALVSVNTMEIHVWGIHRKSQHFKFFKAFLIEIKKKNLKFKVRKLELATVFPDKNQLISLIKCLDIDHIVSINLIRTTGFQFEELSKTEQFKKLKELSVETRHEISPELLSHLDSFKVTVKRMIGEVVSEIIKNYITRNPPHGSSFTVRSCFPIGTNRAILRSILEELDDSQNYSVVDPAVLNKLSNDYFLYARLFKLNNPNHILIVFVFKRKVSGVICNIKELEKESKRFICE